MELKRARSRHALCGALALLFAAASAAAADYVLDIDGKKIELDLDHPTKADMGDGKTARLVLTQSKEQTWRDDGVSFRHPAVFAPARRNLDKNITQTIMTTPSGSMILMQHYIGTDPNLLVDVMVSSLTDEEVKAGYERSSRSAHRRLADGTVLSGKTVHTEHPGDKWDREIVAVGDHDGGYLVISSANDSSTDVDHGMIDTFWLSLRLPSSKLEPLQ